MRKCWIIILVGILLCGCSSTKNYESVMDTIQPVMAEPLEVCVALPENAAKEAMVSEAGGSLYFCDGYYVTVQTVESGDIRATLEQTTGFLPEQLSVMETRQGDYKCYDCVWSAAGETGDQIGRCSVIDDGHYHYILTAMTAAEKAGQLTQGAWDQMFDSFCVAVPEERVSIGS